MGATFFSSIEQSPQSEYKTNEQRLEVIPFSLHRIEPALLFTSERHPLLHEGPGSQAESTLRGDLVGFPFYTDSLSLSPPTMPTPPSVRSTRVILILFFAVASLYYISRSYSRIPYPPTADSFIPGGREPPKNPAQFPTHVDDAEDQASRVEGPPGLGIAPGGKPRQVGKMKAAFVTLVRNGELWEILKSIRQIEDRFNRKYHYPWVFLNDVPFTEEFMDVVSGLISGDVKFGTHLPHIHG